MTKEMNDSASSPDNSGINDVVSEVRHEQALLKTGALQELSTRENWFS